MATSARGKSRQRRGEFIKQQRRLGRRTDIPIPQRFKGKIAKKKGDPDYPDRWDVKGARRIADIIGGASGDFKDMAIDVKDKFADWMPEGAKERFLGLPKAAVDAFARNAEEAEAASRDYDIPFYKGGNPLAVDKGDYVDTYLRGGAKGLTSLIKDQDAYNEALKKDRLFTTNLDEMTDNNYETKAGYLALLRDRSRLKDMAPIRALNYMRSITGDPSNVGFDQLEAMRAGNFEGLNLPGTADRGDYGGLTATQIANKLLPEYYEQANKMYGEGFIGNTAAANYGDASVPPVINQATGVAPVDIERLRLQGKGGHQDLTTIAPQADEIWDTIPTSVFGEDDKELGINWGVNESLYPQMNFTFPYGQLGDPDVSAEGEEFLEPFNAANMYPNLNLAGIRNMIFPGMNLEDITQENISNALMGPNRDLLTGLR